MSHDQTIDYTQTEPPADLDDDWTEPNVTRSEAIASGLFVADWCIGEEGRGYGRSRDEAIGNALVRVIPRPGAVRVHEPA